MVELCSLSKLKVCTWLCFSLIKISFTSLVKFSLRALLTIEHGYSGIWLSSINHEFWSLLYSNDNFIFTELSYHSLIKKTAFFFGKDIRNSYYYDIIESKKFNIQNSHKTINIRKLII